MQIAEPAPVVFFNHLSRRMRVSTSVYTFPRHTDAHSHVHPRTPPGLLSSTHSCQCHATLLLTDTETPGQATSLPLPHSMSSQLPSPVLAGTTVFFQHILLSSSTDPKVHPTFILSFLRYIPLAAN